MTILKSSLNKLIAILLLSAVSLNAGSSIKLDIKKTNGFPLFTTDTTTIIEPNDKNRGVCIAWDSDGLYATVGSHCFTIEGEKGPNSIFFRLKNLREGVYGVQSILYTTEGEQRSNVVTLHVIGENDDRAARH